MAYNPYKDYNPYEDIQKVYNAKVGWNNAKTDEERKNYNDIANKARETLSAYGYGDVVNQISAEGADATKVRQIMDSYAPKTYTDTELINKNNNEVNTKVNELWGTQTKDHDETNGLWKKEYDDLKKTNPFTTEEAKAILGKYDLSALQGRDNAVASGGSVNGGNIDSYAAANALRQQTAIINKGQSMVLDSYNKKLENARAILEGMGAYQQESYKGMQNTIGIQQEEGQRLFENDQTAKNNEVARLKEEAGVTGYTPTEWVIKNDAVYSEFLNPDGSFKKDKEGTDIQALINSTTDAETKKKLAVVRAKKILGNYGDFGQYSNTGDISFMTPEQTEAAKQFRIQDATTKEALKSEKEINEANNQNKLDQIKAEKEGEKDILKLTKELSETDDGAKLSEEGADVFKQVKNNINKGIVQNYGEKYSLPDDYEIIQWNGGTDYKLNLPDGHSASWWKTQIIRPIIESSLSEDDIASVLVSLFGDNADEYYADVYTSMKNNGQIK